MSREIKRVPVDFDWPREKTWEGYLRPESLNLPACPDCDGGYSRHARQLRDLWYGYLPFYPETTGSTPFTPETPEVRAFAERNVTRAPDFYGTGEQAIRNEARRLTEMWNKQWCHHLHQDDVDVLVKAGRLKDFTHTFVKGVGWTRIDPPVHPSAEEVNHWSLRGMGHDSINAHLVIVARCEREGQPHLCRTCNGRGDVATEKQIAAHEAWEPTDPPVGTGWQVWETVSEGSPITPVFETREGLIRYLMSPSYRWGISTPMTREQAEAFTAAGMSIGSFVSANGELIDGDKAVHELASKD